MSYVSWWHGSPCSHLPSCLALSKPRSNEEVTSAQRLQRPAWEGFLVLSLALPSQKETLQTPPVL